MGESDNSDSEDIPSESEHSESKDSKVIASESENSESDDNLLKGTFEIK